MEATIRKNNTARLFASSFAAWRASAVALRQLAITRTADRLDALASAFAALKGAAARRKRLDARSQAAAARALRRNALGTLQARFACVLRRNQRGCRDWFDDSTLTE